MLTLEKLKSELQPYQNTLVLDGMQIVRLMDAEKHPEDFYWKMEGRKKIYLTSCVGGWTPLKGNLNDDDYQALVSLWNMNHKNKAV